VRFAPIRRSLGFSDVRGGGDDGRHDDHQSVVLRHDGRRGDDAWRVRCDGHGARDGTQTQAGAEE
jgi:hypothetical protein